MDLATTWPSIYNLVVTCLWTHSKHCLQATSACLFEPGGSAYVDYDHCAQDIVLSYMNPAVCALLIQARPFNVWGTWSWLHVLWSSHEPMSEICVLWPSHTGHCLSYMILDMCALSISWANVWATSSWQCVLWPSDTVQHLRLYDPC